MEATTAVASYTFSISGWLIFGIIAVIFSKSFRDFVEDWGLLFMILSIHFYGFVGWLLLWGFYEYVVFLKGDSVDSVDTNTQKKSKKKSKKSKKSCEIDNDNYFENLEKIRKEEKRRETEYRAQREKERKEEKSKKPKKKYI